MKRNRLASVVLIMLMVSGLLARGQDRLSPEGRRLASALSDLQKTPDDPVIQQHYLNAFPHDYERFISLFGPNRELEDGHQFILALPSLAKNHEAEVGRLLVQLGKDARWDVDAPNALQEVTVQYGAQYPRAFASFLQHLTAEKRNSLITFLAAKQVIVATHTEYQDLIDHLRSAGQPDLAKEFEAAREKQLQRPRG